MFKKYRKLRNLTLEQVAEKTNISWRNLQRIENGSYPKARFETIAKLMIALDMNDKDIIEVIKDTQKK